MTGIKGKKTGLQVFGTLTEFSIKVADLPTQLQHEAVSGLIEITANSNVFQTCWADLIKAANAALPCWNVDTQVIWDRFLAFNRARGFCRLLAPVAHYTGNTASLGTRSSPETGNRSKRA